jgi:hypothetical protein
MGMKRNELQAKPTAGFFGRIPRRTVTMLLVLGIVFAISMYQASRPIRSVQAQVGERKIQLDLKEDNGVVYGIAVEGDKQTRTALAVLTAYKAASMGLPLVNEKQLRDAEMSTDKATGVCQFTLAPGHTIGFDPQSFTWRARTIEQ